MKIDLIWSGIVYDKEKTEKCIWDASFSPNGSKLAVATDKCVILYNTTDGSRLKVLKSHKSAVYCVSYSSDGTMLASGSADGTVIIWNTESLEGILKFLLNDSVQCLSFNPVTSILISGAVTEFGMWSPDQKSIKKTRVACKVTSCSWTSDGQYVALGLFNGVVSIRNRTGEEKVKIERTGGAISPVWTLQWTPTKTDQSDILAVGDWGQKLSFYQLSGKKVIYPDGVSDIFLTLKQRILRGNIGKEISLGFDPCSVCWLQNSAYLLVAGSDQKVYLYTKDGIKLDNVFQANSWLWCCRTKPTNENQVVTCGQDGSINFHQIQFLTVHSLYRDRYAFREGMTDVIIHHLLTDQKARIKCKDIVRKIAIYKNRLAIQFPDKVTIYQPQSDDPKDMQYRVAEKICKTLDCNLMIVTTKHLVLCEERRLSSYGYSGTKEREWLMDSPIRYTKTIGGPEYREGILIAQKNGQITKIFLDNHFPIPVLRATGAVKCLDLSLSRTKLGVIDDTNMLSVYEQATGDILFQESGVISLAWNTKNDDMLCYAGETSMFIKASNYPSHEIKETGLVVGFNGTKVYMLQEWNMKTVEIPQSAAMYSYIQREELDLAYKVACLGVTSADWLALGQAGVARLANLGVARQAFVRLRDPFYLRLIAELEDTMSHGENNQDILIGDVCAYLCNFSEAAKFYRQANAEHKALEMYSDIRQFDQAKSIAAKSNPEETKAILAKQADWAKSTKEHHSAVNMYLEAGQFAKALEVMRENRWADMMIDLARKLDLSQKDLIHRAGAYLADLDNFLYASECHQKAGNISAMVAALVDGRLWEEAFSVLKRYPEYKEKVYMPYGRWLAENDKFEEAQIAFHKAGLESQAISVLEKLTSNSVAEHRFNDASFYFWKLSVQCLDIAREVPAKREEMMKKFRDFQQKADIYYVYFNLHRFMEEPFSTYIPEAYFSMSRFLLHQMIGIDKLPGVSKVVVLFTLAKQAKSLGAFKMARYAFEKMQSLRLPDRLKKSAQLGALTIRSKPFHDNEDILLMCYRCSTTNPLLNQAGNICVNCQEPFVHSFVSFETLPLVEFVPDEGILDEEAVELLTQEPQIAAQKKPGEGGPGGDQWNENRGAEMQSLVLNEQETSEFTNDPFSAKILSMDITETYSCVVLDRETLRNVSCTEVIVLKWPAPLRYQFFKNVMSDVTITRCEHCLRLFHTEDFELQLLQKGHCPFCRTEITN